MKINAISPILLPARYQRCPECDTLFSLLPIKPSQSAHCPRCNACIFTGRDWSMTRLCSIAVTMLLLMPFSFSEPLMSVSLLGSTLSASLVSGIMLMAHQGDVITATMVAFCTLGAPITLVVSILYLWLGHRLGMNLRPALMMLRRLKEWVMLDIYLIGIAIASIKVKDYAALEPGTGLIAIVTLTLLSLILLIHLNVEQLWQRFYPQAQTHHPLETLRVCLNCHFTGQSDNLGRCPRCHSLLRQRRQHSLQKSWAALLTSIVFLIPANMMPISIVYINGARKEDTILSGIISLAGGNILIAALVFIASILVPMTKVLVLFTVLTSIHLRCTQGLKTRIHLLRLVTWVGRWSMLDLFVISLTMSLVSRDQLLAFTMGPAAFYFGTAVVLTILAADWLDRRLLWDVHATGNTK